MFVGRDDELNALEKLYASNNFEMMVVYGRRRVGKTALIEHFAQGKSTISFTAQLQADKDNLADFSTAVASHFGLPEETPSFASWSAALSFVAKQPVKEKLVLVIDEFPYACKQNPSLPSAMQVAIDKDFKSSNALLILCGSNQGFMEEEVLSEESPLYGRRSGQIRLKPFDYFDAAKMMPKCSSADRLSYYAALGGTPYYLAGIDPTKSYKENITDLFFVRTGRMYDEPAMLLRQELRQPAVFSSVLRAIAHGATRSNQIADAAGLSTSAITFYLKTLISLDLLEKVVPFGDSEKSKRGIYRIKDPAFTFWFRFVAPYMSAVESGLGESVATRLLKSDRRNEYEGHVFEDICRQWVVRQARGGQLPIEPTEVSNWWGTDSAKHEQADIDVVAADDIEKRILLGECKWREHFNETETLDLLQDRTRLIPGYSFYALYLFTKRPVSSATRNKTLATCVCIEDMYED